MYFKLNSISSLKYSTQVHFLVALDRGRKVALHYIFFFALLFLALAFTEMLDGPFFYSVNRDFAYFDPGKCQSTQVI